jgi:hypothetical protein
MTNTLDYYTNIKTPTVVSGITSTKWLSMIQDNEYKDTIQDLRNGYGDKTRIKESLPCVTYNYNFTSKRANANVCSSTGLFFIDIDDSTFNPSILDSDKIYAYYKSLGGNGYHVIVQVADIPINSYKSTYRQIVSELGLVEFADNGAAKMSQPTVLSYDRNLFINEDSYIFSATTEDIKTVSPTDVYREKKETYSEVGDTKLNNDTYRIRYDNLSTYEFNGDYIVDWGNIDVIKAYIPINKVSNGSRASSMMAYAVNLLYLNPWLYKEKMIGMLGNVNSTMCIEPLGSQQIFSIVESVFKYQEEGTLEPIYSKKKRSIIFKEGAGWTKEDKMSTVHALLREKRSNDSIQKLYDIIEEWDWDVLGKLSIRKVSSNYPISTKTVAKYWGEFKEYVDELNDEYKLNNK